MAKMTKITTHLTADQKRQLEQLRDRDGRTVAEHIRQAIAEYLEKQKNK